MPRRAVRFARRRIVSKATGGAPLSAPTFTSTPAILGSAVVGATLTAVDGTAIGNPSPTITRAWLRDGSPISGATGGTYLLVEADEGATITLRNTATNSEGSVQSTSDGVGPVAPAGTATLEPFDVTLTNTSNSTTLAAGPSVFGHTFAKGEVPAGSGLTATINAVPQEPQVDWISTYSDGSLKQASIVVDRPALIAGATATCSIAPGTPTDEPEVNVATLLSGRSISLAITGITTRFTDDATVTTTPADVTIDLKAAILAAIASPVTDATNPTYWLRGHKCTQVRTVHQGAANAYQTGSLAQTSMRVVVDTTIFANGDILVDLQGYNSRLLEADRTGKGRFDATWTVTIDGVTRYTKAKEQIHRVAFRKRIWDKDAATARWPASQDPDGSLAKLLVSIPHQRWAVSGAIFPMDDKIEPDTDKDEKYASYEADPTWMQPLWHNHIADEVTAAGEGSRDMGSVSGGDQAFMDSLGEPANRWLLGPRILFQRIALGWADGMFASTNYIWDTNRDHWLDRSYHTRIQAHDYHNASYDPDDPTITGLNTARNRQLHHLSWSATEHFLPQGGNLAGTTVNAGYQIWHAQSHIPRPAYFAYLATSERAWYDQQLAQAAHVLVNINYGDCGGNLEYPNHYDNWFYNDPRAMTREIDAWHEVRGSGWGMYVSDNARYIARNGSHYDTYWNAVVHRTFDGMEKQRNNMLAFYTTGPDARQGYPLSRVMDNSSASGRVKRHGTYHLGYYFMAAIHSPLRMEDTDPRRAWAINHLELLGRFWEGYFDNPSGFDWRYLMMSGYFHSRYRGLGGQETGTSFMPVKTWTAMKEAMDLWESDVAAYPGDGEPARPMGFDTLPAEFHNLVPYYENHAASTTGIIALLYKMWRDRFGDPAKAAKFLGYYRTIMGTLGANCGANALSRTGNGFEPQSGYQRRMRGVYTLGDEGEDPAFNEHANKGQLAQNLPSQPPVLSAPGSVLTVPEGTAAGFAVAQLTASNAATGLPKLGVFAPTITAQTVANAFKLRHDLTLVTDTGFVNASYATHGGSGLSVTCRVANDAGNSNTVTFTVPIADSKPMITGHTFSITEHAPTADPAVTLTAGQQIGVVNILSPAAVTAVEITSQTPAGAMDLGTVSGSAPNFTVPLRVLDPTKFDFEGTNPATATVRAENANGFGTGVLQTVNIGNVVEAGDPEPLPLDALVAPDSTIYRAMGLFRLRSAYNGPLVRVYDGEADATGTAISAGGDGWIDWTAASAVRTGSNRLLLEFYDQNTGALISSTAASRRPWLSTTGGAMLTMGGIAGKPVVQFDRASGHYLRQANQTYPSTTSIYSVMTIADVDGAGDSDILLLMGVSGEGDENPFTVNSFMPFNNSGNATTIRTGRWGTFASGTVSAGTAYVASALDNGSSVTLRLNGAQAATDNIAATSGSSTYRLCIGGRTPGINHCSFKTNAIVVMSATTSSDVAAIETAIRTEAGF